MITKVQLPMARPAIVLATNQGLLYVLSMVVIGGMVGAGSLGYIVVSGFSQGQLFGKGLAAGSRSPLWASCSTGSHKYTAARYGRLTTSFARPARNITKGTTSTWHVHRTGSGWHAWQLRSRSG